MKLRDVVKVIGNLGRGRQKIHHAIGVRIRERLQQNSIYNREDRGVRADAEGKSSDGGKGETGILTQLAQGEACILPKQLNTGAGATTPHRLLDPLDTARLGLGEARGLGCGHAVRDPFVHHHIHVPANFIVKLVLDTGLTEEISKSAFETRP